MSDLNILGLDGTPQTLDADALEGLGAQLRGDLVTATSSTTPRRMRWAPRTSTS
jgi:hypothetical protein